MTSKEFVMNNYPSATATKVPFQHYKQKGNYWIIKMAGATEEFAAGITERAAWVKAKKRIIENNNF